MDRLKFSGIGRKGIIEERDCLFNPWKVERSSYLRKRDVFEPSFIFDKPYYLKDKTEEELSKERETLTV